MRTTRTSLLASLLLAALHPAAAHAFAEDVCYPQNADGSLGAATSCNPLPAACLPAGTASDACQAAALATFGTSTATMLNGRSTVHVDATHLLAQAVGFSATDAYWIAAYDEATDLGVFAPRDAAGAVVGGAALTTSNIDGFVRTNAGVGGEHYHFSAPRVAGTDGLHPEAQDPDVEPILAHVRRWAWQGVGASVVACTGAATARSSSGDYATGSQCYADASEQPGTVGASFAVLNGASITAPTIATGYQVVTTAGNSPTGSAILSPAFDAAVGGTPARARDARLGIYLHVLADRVSHHVCVDRTTLTGPSSSPPTFNAAYTDPECEQDLHALRHIWETGVPFSQLPSAHRTTEAALAAVYDELVTFAQARGTLRPGANAAAYRTAVLTALTGALQVPGAVQRMNAIAGVACNRGLTPFPGTITCGA